MVKTDGKLLDNEALCRYRGVVTADDNYREDVAYLLLECTVCDGPENTII